MSSEESFWSDKIAADLPRVPLEVIREATAGLARLTSGRLEGEVKSASEEPGFITHRIGITAPTIGFRIHIGTFRHRAATPYPVWAVANRNMLPAYSPGNSGRSSFFLSQQVIDSLPRETVVDPPGEKLLSEEELKNWLRNLLRSDEIAALVNGILATLRSAADQSPTDDGGDE